MRRLIKILVVFTLLLPSVSMAVVTPAFSKAQLGLLSRNGANPEQVRALLNQMEGYIAQLAKRNNIPLPALRGSLTEKIIRAPANDRTYEKAYAQAESSAKQIKTLTAENAALSAELKQIKDAKLRTPALLALAEAQKAIDEGRLEDAETALAALEPLRLSEVVGASEAWSKIVDARADVALLKGDYDRTRELQRAARLDEKKRSEKQQWHHAVAEADALYQKGIALDDLKALRDAKSVYSDIAIPLVPQLTERNNWAKTQAKIGAALVELTTREGGSQNAIDAISAFDSALKIQNQFESPLDWADSQHGLGVALSLRGKQLLIEYKTVQSAEMYTRARAAFDKSLEVITRKEDRWKWPKRRDI